MIKYAWKLFRNYYLVKIILPIIIKLKYNYRIKFCFCCIIIIISDIIFAQIYIILFKTLLQTLFKLLNPYNIINAKLKNLLGGSIMLNFKPLTLEDKAIFDKYLKPYKFKTCEYSFTSLFMWRKALDIQFAIYKDMLIIKKLDFQGSYHLMEPIGYTRENLKEVVSDLMNYKTTEGLDYLFKDAEEPFIHDLREVFGDELIIEEDRDNFDYIYTSEKLISLSGKKLHSKKNHYNNFIKNNTYRVEPITDGLICDCIKAAREWCRKNDCKGYLLYELRAIEEMLKSNHYLDFKGMIIYVNDKISAFTIGEQVNDEMAIIHVEKADSTINGLYAFINKTFVENYFSHVPFINREQDLGIEGLRKAKLTYQPVRLEPKYLVKF